jgi:hypothetical protein
LYERATRIWETPTGQLARAQLNEEWKRAETQHRNEARLLHDRASAVRASISRQFGEEFPEFAKPVSGVRPDTTSETDELLTGSDAPATSGSAADSIPPASAPAPIIPAVPVTPAAPPATAP